MNVSINQDNANNIKGGQTRTHSLVATKSFKVGEVIYKESPLVVTLDVDLQGTGKRCSHCLREIGQDFPAVAESDRLRSVYCSVQCQTRSTAQSQDMLFSDKSPLPLEVAIDLPQLTTANRPKSQDAFAEFYRQTGSSGLILVARLIATQIVAELAKALPQAAYMKALLPEMCVSDQYTVYDHLERLRSIDVSVSEEEYKKLKDLVLATLPFLDDAHSDERHTAFRGKVAYNAIGIYFGEGRNDKPTAIDTHERTRIAVGTSKQVGSGLYLFSSYLTHSCAPSTLPSFNSGTSELHLVALRDIEEGEELTMAYVDVSQSNEESPAEAYARRRSELSQGWKFACTCAACEEERQSLSLGESENKEDGVPN